MTINNNSTNYTFIEHLDELKSRIISTLIILVIATITVFFLHKQIIEVLIKPLNSPLYYTTPTGGFTFIFDISLSFGIIMALPFFLYEIYMFIKPALPLKQSVNITSALVSSYLLVICGIAYGYYFSLPIALNVLKRFGYGQITYLITTDSYLSFITKYLLGFSILFQLPLILIMINLFKKLSLLTLIKFEKWLILIAVISAAILTPTGDIINQLIMCIPLIVLYQVSILLVVIINRSR